MIAAERQHAESITPEPTGASSAFTSRDPVILECRDRMDRGEFAGAEETLRPRFAAGDATAGELLDILDRIRIAYRLSSDDLLARLRPDIPDVTAADLERWRAAGQVQFRSIDGRIGYFAREPANLFRFCDEAKRRRRESPADRLAWSLESHLARVIQAARAEHRAEVVPIRHRVHYTLTIHPDAPGLHAGAMLRVWLPFPQEYLRQRDVHLISASPPNPRIAANATGEFPIAGALQRTAYFECRVDDPTHPPSFSEGFEFTTSAYYPLLEDVRAQPLPRNWSGGNLGERPPHILFTPELRKTVAQVVGNETNPLVRARRIWRFVAERVAYCAEEEYGTIPSLSEKALRSLRGDCGVQSMLFITMCRAAGIPARWQSGWETRRTGMDMHDWAEFYVDPWGWLPADPSYGLRPSDDPGIREFYFGHQDSYRLIVNRDYGSALFPPKHSLRSEPLDFQRGEVEIDGVNLYFPYWDYDIQIEYLNDGP